MNVMGRIIDYVNWRGDLSFEQEPFNQIDAAIFSQFSLLDFDDVVPTSGEGIPLSEVFERYLAKGHNVKDRVSLLISNKQHYLFEATAKAPRYKNLLFSNYSRIYDEENPCQFEAMTINLGKQMLISFGGTDDTIVDWHEDFELLYLEEIPSHKYGHKYLEKISKLTNQEILICGHSKGANIAMEVLLSAPEEIFNRVPKVYCFDGPGISQKVYEQAVLDGRIGKIIAYIPYKASIGKLFDHYEEFKIVECTANFAFQHDLLTWHVMGNDFIYKDHLSADSIHIEKHFKKIINGLSMEEKILFVSALFNMFYAVALDGKTLTDIHANRGRFIAAMMKLKSKEKTILNEVLFKEFLGDPKVRKIMINFLREFNNRD